MAVKAKRSGALDGVRVLDLTSIIFGPYATQLLADMGAEVIKVEGPGTPDMMRLIEPQRSPGMGAIYMNVNRNKKSLALDLKRPEAREALLKLAATCDVFVHSMRPKAIGKLGLAYAALKEARADVIYASAWGFRADGPYGDRPAYDDVIQTMAGVGDLTRRQDGEPRLTPTIFADKSSGLMLATALLAALFHRQRTGEGQEIEVPMLETVTSLVMVEHLAGATFEPPIEGGPGYNRVLSPYRKPQRTKDGFMTVLPYTDRHWRAFFELAGQPSLAEDERFRDAKSRSRNISSLYAIMSALVAARTTAEWLALLERAEIPCAKVVSLEDILVDPHLVATGFWQEYEHPSEGRVRTTAFPVRFAATPGDALRRPPPRLGADTRQVLAEAGLGVDEIERLIASGAASAG